MRFLLFLICLGSASAGELVLPSPALERDRSITVVFRTGSQLTGKGDLALLWTDALGRVVEDRKIAVELTDETEIRFTLDMRRAVAMSNTLLAHLSLDGVNRLGAKDHREDDAGVAFVARPPDRHWQDYAIIMWQPHSAERFARLATLGINGGQYHGRSRTPPEFLLKNDLRWYAENIATDFYSEYHRYRADRIQNWSYLQAKDLYKKDSTSKEAFKRHPSFSDAAWLAKIHDRLVETARYFSPYRPFFYDLGDESGIADLAAFWDFDFSDESLGEMRAWLKERYGTLAALNLQWGSRFDAWEHVVPDTTHDAMRRSGENFSAWSDHKEWMDVSYARALKMGVEAIRSVDPEAPVGIAGAQMPGWGGYDYWRLSQVLTAIEPYDIGNNIELLRSFNPALPIVTTAFARGPWEKHRIWYELLHGARGNIIWDEKAEHVSAGGEIGARGREVGPYYREIASGIGALLIDSVRQSDPIAIHYSQPSMRVEWMLAQRPKGETWVDRTSSTERRDSEFLRLRESYCRLIEDLGFQYRFVSYAQVEQGELAKYRVLILPRSSALSAAEAAQIREFVDRGGLLIADGDAGMFDEHGRRLEQPSLAGVKASPFSALDYHQQRLIRKEGPVHEAMKRLLESAALRPAIHVTPAVGIEAHTFRNSGVSLLALLSNPSLRVDELGPPEFQSNERFEQPQAVHVVLPAEMYVYDIRGAKLLGRRQELGFTLDPYEPALFALSASPLPAMRVSAPARVTRGGIAAIAVADPAAPRDVYHFEVTDPAGKRVPHYCGNMVGGGIRRLPFAANDPPGKWTITIRDMLSGELRPVAIDVI